MAPTVAQPRMSVQEYLAFERAATTKHQYAAGEVFAMAGASPRHNGIVANLVTVIGQAVADTDCRVFASDLKIHAPAFELFAYPDVSVICGDLALYAGSADAVLNPKVLIEVLSDSTERYDRGQKAEAYRTIPSLSDYLLIEQRKVHVEHYARRPDGSWLLREMNAGGQVSLASVSLAVDVDAIYHRVFDLPQ